MDITKLFDNQTNITPLENARIEAMIDQALAYPQIQKPANQNGTWIKRALAVAAAIALVVTVSLQFSPIQTAPAETASDAFDEVSDLMLLETLNDLS